LGTWELGWAVLVLPFTMKNSTQDQVEGTAKKLAGKAAEGVGKSTGDRQLEADGKKEQVKGAVQKKVGDVKQVFGH
jgi:uncharacterized protein YjbJ (UPF0337 family)